MKTSTTTTTRTLSSVSLGAEPFKNIILSVFFPWSWRRRRRPTLAAPPAWRPNPRERGAARPEWSHLSPALDYWLFERCSGLEWTWNIYPETFGCERKGTTWRAAQDKAVKDTFSLQSPVGVCGSLGDGVQI